MLPIDVIAIARYLERQCHERTWYILTEQARPGVTFDHLSQRLKLSRERLFQLDAGAVQVLGAGQRDQQWVDLISTLSLTPRAVQVPETVEHAWPVLIRVVRAAQRDALPLYSARIAPGVWALTRVQQAYQVRSLTLPPAQFVSEEAAPSRSGAMRAVATRVNAPAVQTATGRVIWRVNCWKFANLTLRITVRPASW